MRTQRASAPSRHIRTPICRSNSWRARSVAQGSVIRPPTPSRRSWAGGRRHDSSRLLFRAGRAGGAGAGGRAPERGDRDHLFLHRLPGARPRLGVVRLGALARRGVFSSTPAFLKFRHPPRGGRPPCLLVQPPGQARRPAATGALPAVARKEAARMRVTLDARGGEVRLAHAIATVYAGGGVADLADSGAGAAGAGEAAVGEPVEVVEDDRRRTAAGLGRRAAERIRARAE